MRQRAAFVEQLANHSEAGRMHSQDASFLQPSHRSRSQPALADDMHDPHALLSLPEFIREGIPDVVQHRMQLERDPEALLSLPEFMKEHPVPQVSHMSRTGRGQSVSQITDITGESHVPQSATQKLKGRRSRSMSEPLAWLLSAKPSSSSSGSTLGLKRRGSKRQIRPGSSSGASTPIIEGKVHAGSTLSTCSHPRRSSGRLLRCRISRKPPTRLRFPRSLRTPGGLQPRSRSGPRRRCRTRPPLPQM